MTASTSPLCRDDRLARRADLVLRPLPEIRMCMVYRPRPARVVTLNPSSWLLLEACDGGTVAEIEATVLRAQHGTWQAFTADTVLSGLQQLVGLALVDVSRDSPPTTPKEQSHEGTGTLPPRPPRGG